jgi:photosystem II stability/assembly factor-like uncharacterized protein
LSIKKKEKAGIGFALLMGIVLLLPQLVIKGGHSKPARPKGEPMHPGWLSQWREMRGLTGGIDDVEKMRLARQSAMEVRSMKSGGILGDLTELGPGNVGGRTRAFCIDVRDSSRYLAAGISGGIWESNSSGFSWNPVQDDAANLSVTGLAQDPFNPNHWVYCSGEPAGNSAGIPGAGIFESWDDAQTFQLISGSGVSPFLYAWRILFSPVDSGTFYVATATGGLWRTQNQGQQFEQVFGNSNVTDLHALPSGTVVIGVHGQGVYRSFTGASGSFVLSSAGLPPNFRRIEMAVAPSDSSTWYAILENSNGDDVVGVYRTTDAGGSWTLRGNPSGFGIRFYFPWYCLALEVDPLNAARILVGSVTSGFSTDGGTTWDELPDSHADYHGFTFLPGQNNVFVAYNDGGLYRYTFQQVNTAFVQSLNEGYRITQFYAGTYWPTGQTYIGGTQDNGTHQGQQVIGGTKKLFGGDGGFAFKHQQINNVGYVSWQNGHLLRSDNIHEQFPDFDYILNGLDSDFDDNVDENTWFISPFEGNPLDGDQLYFVTRFRAWMSISRGSLWFPITAPVANLYAIGVTNEVYPSIYFGGTGKFYRVLDAYGSVAGDEDNLSGTIPSSMAGKFMSCIKASPVDTHTLFIGFSSYSTGPMMWKVTQANASPVWTDITGDFPLGLPVNSIEVSPWSEQILFAATDYGLYYTTDGGQHWLAENQIPMVSIHQLRMRSDGRLFVFSHGRGIFSGTLEAPISSMSGTKVQVKCWPNPAGNRLWIDGIAPGSRFEIVNMQGQRLQSGKMTLVPGFIPLEGLPQGRYFIRCLDTEAAVGTVSFIKQ